MKPTVVICPGAWQLEAFYDPLKRAFEALDYPTVCKLSNGYPDHDPDETPEINLDTTFLREHVLKPLVEEGKEIVLFMHSYGGVYGPAALEGFGELERKRAGLQGGVIAAIYTAAFIARKGTSTMSVMGFSDDNLPSWIDLDEATGLVSFHKDHAKVMVFHDLPPEEAERLASSLPKQPASCFSEPVHWDPYEAESFQGRLGYIYTEADRILPLDFQKRFVQTAGIKHTAMLEGCSHSPHIEMPKKLAETVIGMLDTLTR
ncbi:alpha/beta-hydrolase [Massarina eburnea CBS 473.64]|uniref:Alpha/beta-hydrolase n=1 Tax=Massarina eburnea CBS 473.64 TaxID=1395130 RepID=A0A6A6RVB0_9PLEO|nr:alpha/beta-hydrolase [Massarina eburnea CBS 473.64]